MVCKFTAEAALDDVTIAAHVVIGHNLKLKTCTVRNALKLRHGTFCNTKLARCFQKPYLGKASDGRCPLCRNPDSGTHVLGACTHGLVKGLNIERPNGAVATAGKAIMKRATRGLPGSVDGRYWMAW